jgi:hypothetical protein
METFTPYQSANLRALIESTLNPLQLWNEDAEELLLATCAQESLFGTYRTQGDGGPARGIFQMEGEDHDDIWNNYLKYHPGLADQLRTIANGNPVTEEMTSNDAYAIAMARVHYLRKPGALPSAYDLNALWSYYKKWYNTPEGAATQAEFNRHYQEYVTDGKAS